MVRFRILTHDFPFEHWDLLIESDNQLLTWRLLKEPLISHAEEALEVTAEQLNAHRLIYLEYEGPVSGNRGSVAEWDRGTCEVLSRQPHRLHMRFDGQRLTGLWELVQSNSIEDPSRASSGPDTHWRFRFRGP